MGTLRLDQGHRSSQVALDEVLNKGEEKMKRKSKLDYRWRLIIEIKNYRGYTPGDIRYGLTKAFKNKWKIIKQELVK